MCSKGLRAATNERAPLLVVARTHFTLCLLLQETKQLTPMGEPGLCDCSLTPNKDSLHVVKQKARRFEGRDSIRIVWFVHDPLSHTNLGCDSGRTGIRSAAVPAACSSGLHRCPASHMLT